MAPTQSTICVWSHTVCVHTVWCLDCVGDVTIRTSNIYGGHHVLGHHYRADLAGLAGHPWYMASPLTTTRVMWPPQSCDLCRHVTCATESLVACSTRKHKYNTNMEIEWKILSSFPVWVSILLPLVPIEGHFVLVEYGMWVDQSARVMPQRTPSLVTRLDCYHGLGNMLT